MTAMTDPGPTLRTERLLLRRWRDGDRAPFAAMNADPEVTRYLGATLDRAGSDAIVDRAEAAFDAEGFGLWAVERLDDGRFIGFVGLARPSFETSFTPCVEIGWRLARDAWGHGYATEGASAVRDHAFDVVGLDELLSWTTVANAPSRRVMERIGMTHDPDDDFDHPRLPVGHTLRRHVLYRLARQRRSTPPFVVTVRAAIRRGPTTRSRAFLEVRGMRPIARLGALIDPVDDPALLADGRLRDRCSGS